MKTINLKNKNERVLTMYVIIIFGSRLADLHLILPNEVPQLSC